MNKKMNIYDYYTIIVINKSINKTRIAARAGIIHRNSNENTSIMIPLQVNLYIYIFLCLIFSARALTPEGIFQAQRMSIKKTHLLI